MNNPVRKRSLLIATLSLVLFSCRKTGSATVSSAVLSSLSTATSASVSYRTEAFLTDENHRLEKQASPAFVSTASAAQIKLSSAGSGVAFEGAGAAMTHSSAKLLESLPAAQKAAAFASLFGPEEGRFSCVRIPLGTSDYTYTDSFYTFDDIASGKDYDLTSFSLGEDLTYLIPALKDALSVNPSLTFIAAPWSAPAWMKDTNSLIGGSLVSNSDGTNSQEEISYSSYLVKAVEAFQKQGITISYLSLENEPTDFGGSISYPNMYVPAAQWKRVAKSVGYQLKAMNLPTKILAYDHNIGDSGDNAFYKSYADLVENDSTLSSYVAGFAIHCYSGSWTTAGVSYLAQQKIRFPDKKFFITEITEHSGSGTAYGPRLDWSLSHVVLDPLKSGASGVLYWNLLLTDQGQPTKNPSICYGLLSKSGDNLSKTPAFDSLSQVSHFLYPINGKAPSQVSLSLPRELSALHGVGYLRGDDSYVVSLLNAGDTAIHVDLSFQAKYLPLSLGASQAWVVLISPEA
jgi:glucosylceramidase